MDRFTRKCVMDRKIVQNLVEGKSFNKISNELKVGKRRIRKIHDMAKKAGYLSGTPLPAYPLALFDYPGASENNPVSETDKELMEHLQWIKERREAGWHLVTIHEELPVKVHKSSFYRFIHRHGIDDNKEKVRCRVGVKCEIIHDPAEALILDWGKLKDVIDPHTGKKRTVWFLAGVMGFSRYLMVRLVWDNKTETTLNAITSMFDELGGVPRKIISDNPKCFSIKASKYEPILNPAFERFCEHYGVLPEILPPGDPEKKGKIERMVPYVRRLYEAHGEWEGMNESQEYLDDKLLIANQRKHGTTKLRPIEVFLDKEANDLSILPNNAYEVEEYSQAKVRSDGHARFNNKYYSVGDKYYKQEVFIIGNTKVVEIYLKGKLLETHQRISNPYQSKSTKEHHKKPWERLASDYHNYIERAEKIGTSVKEMISNILKAGNGFVDYRKIWGILSLDKNYSSDAINRACADALQCDRLGYNAVLSFLNMNDQKSTANNTKKNKFTRKMEEYLPEKHLH